MSEGPWWVLPLVVVAPIIIIANVVLFTLLPIQPRDMLIAEGLFLNICGAVITLAPDVIGIDKLFEPTEEIKRIEEAQDRLFLRGRIKECHMGYNELVAIIMMVTNTNIEPYPKEVSKSVGGLSVPEEYIMFHHEEYKTMNGDNIGKFISHSSLVDGRISQYVEGLRSRGHQLGFVLGLVLLLVGFVFQFASIIY